MERLNSKKLISTFSALLLFCSMAVGQTKFPSGIQTGTVTLEQQGSTPSNPSSGKNKLYFKSDGNVYKLDSGGTESSIGSGGGVASSLITGSDSDFENTVGSWATYVNQSDTGTCDDTTDRITLSSVTATYREDLPFVYTSSGTPCAGLTSGNTYYVRSPGAGFFRLSATPGGSTIDITSTGTGTHTVTVTKTEPDKGTGGTANITAARTTSSSEKHYANGSLKISKGAADRQGEGVGLLVTVPQQLYARPFNFSFSYSASANFDYGTYTDPTDPSDIVVYFYDATNDDLLIPNISVLDGSGNYNGLIFIPSGCTSLRVVLHVRTANSSSWDFFADNFQLSGAAQATYASISDWQDFPSVAAGTLITAVTSNPTYGTVATNKAQWRRVGDTMEIRWDYRHTTVGTTGSGMYLFNLPAGYQIDTNKAKASTEATAGGDFSDGTVGYFQSGLSTTNQHSGDVAVYDATRLKVRLFGGASGGSTGVNVWGSSFIDFASNAAQDFHLMARVPIVGWTSGFKTASSIGQNVPVSFRAYKASGSQTANTTIASWTTTDDSVSGFNATTGEYTIKQSGDYDATWTATYSAGSSEQMDIAINGTIFGQICAETGSNSCSGSIYLPNLKTGDVLTLKSTSGKTFAASTGTKNIWSLSRRLTPTSLHLLKANTSTDSKPWAVESAYVADGSSTTTVSKESGDWINGSCTNGSAGVYVCTFNSGVFSSAPTCVVNSDGAALFRIPTITATTVEVRTFNSSNSASDGNFHLMCHGPR